MIECVVNGSGNILGYSIDGEFIREDMLKYFASGTRIATGSLMKVTKTPTVTTDYLKVYKGLKKFGINVNQVVFYKRKLTKYDIISPYWEITKPVYKDGSRVYVIESKNGELIGYLSTVDDIYNSESIYINMLEVVTKRVGHGRMCVECLKSFGKPISGLSVGGGAVEFWQECGAVFDKKNSQHFSIN